MKKILLISTNHPKKSSGIVAYDLLQLFKRNGYKVSLITKIYDKYESDIVCIDSFLKTKIERAKRVGLRMFKKMFGIKEQAFHPDYHMYYTDHVKLLYPTSKFLRKINFKPDIIVCLFDHLLINPQNVYELNKITGAKILWYTMDMSPYTSGCHFAWDCQGYKTDCSDCPAVFSLPDKSMIAKNFIHKHNYLNKTDVTFIATSESQFRELLSSKIIEDCKKTKILISVNPEIFKPGNRAVLKKKFDIAEDAKIILIGATQMEQKRKGGIYMLQSLKELYEKMKNDPFRDRVLVLIIGYMDENILKEIPFKSKNLGYIKDFNKLAEAYQAANLFLSTSIEDSGPLMINQAIMSGLPVVSSNIGTALDLIIDGKTGYKVERKDVKSFAEAIYKIIIQTAEEEISMSQNCRELALNLFSPEAQMKQFENLFSGN